MTTNTELIIRRPDDWHLHLRDGSMMSAVLPYSSADFGRAIIMPNILPPVTTMEQATRYHRRIVKATPDQHDFKPLMTFYLTESTRADDIEQAASSGLIKAVKLYPAGATTNSESGVQDIKKVMPVLEKMAEIGLPLLVHGEVADSNIDIFDREAVFIDTVLDPLRRSLPQLRIVMEHVTTKTGVQYIISSDKNLAATITAHHLIINRNDILAGGIRPHYYCLPVAKREKHRLALREAVVSGDSRFFFGSDSAPHIDGTKECGCGCAGIFTAINALECLATVFEQENRLDKLEAFVSLNGPKFYGLLPNTSKIRLYKTCDHAGQPEKIQTRDGYVTVFDPMFLIYWHVENIVNDKIY
ncbi:dihydroorotase [Desulfococcaceae bacterium HSG9]|nr:dihydroorotase [Desulfococcaceae bacterium HSG9]